MLSRTVKQVGGDHYEAEYQHWDLIAEHSVSYLEGNATKYIDRWQKKGGAIDISKAISYLKKRIALYHAEDHQLDSDSAPSYNHLKYRNFTVQPLKLWRWFDAVNMPPRERRICIQILCWETIDDLKTAVTMLENLLIGAANGEDGSGA